MLRLFETALAGVAFLAVGIYSLSRGVAILRGQTKPTRWVTAEAIILRSRVVWDGRTFKPEVWYRYTLKGVEFESSSISQLEFTFNDSDAYAKATVARYQPTARVKVFVDPLHPSSSFLEPEIGLEVEPIGPTLLGILLILAGAGALAAVGYELAFASVA